MSWLNELHHFKRPRDAHLTQVLLFTNMSYSPLAGVPYQYRKAFQTCCFGPADLTKRGVEGTQRESPVVLNGLVRHIRDVTRRGPSQTTVLLTAVAAGTATTTAAGAGRVGSSWVQRRGRGGGG